VLSGADLTGVALPGADLTSATLDGAVFSDADLSDAVLAGAPLAAAVMDGADLSGADLSGADLTAASFVEADLSGAVLAGSALGEATLNQASLTGTDLSGADLRGAAAVSADFEGAVMAGTQLGPNDFTWATGLTDDALASALEVPVAALAGATAERGITFDALEDIIAAVSGVPGGEPVPDARAYAASGDFHPAIVFDSEDLETPVLAEAVQDAWAPTGLRYAELVVVVRPQTWESVEVCPYFWPDGSPAPPVTRYVSQVTVTVLASHDGAVVAEQTFRGTDPRACGATESGSLTELRGEPPDLAAAVPAWLSPVVNPPG
jgi:hypothetical protein